MEQKFCEYVKLSLNPKIVSVTSFSWFLIQVAGVISHLITNIYLKNSLKLRKDLGKAYFHLSFTQKLYTDLDFILYFSYYYFILLSQKLIRNMNISYCSSLAKCLHNQKKHSACPQRHLNTILVLFDG